MNEQVKEMWIDALESGDYRQGQGYLKYYDKTSHRTRHCCLGVLCDLYSKNVAPLEEKIRFTNDERVTKSIAQKPYDLPNIVQNWAGLNDPSGTLSEPVDGKTNLVDLNDDGKTFKEIANIIKEKM
jgi:hypothetical protein